MWGPQESFALLVSCHTLPGPFPKDGAPTFPSLPSPLMPTQPAGGLPSLASGCVGQWVFAPWSAEEVMGMVSTRALRSGTPGV